MSFIGRPNLPEGMWMKAIELAANRSNPMLAQMNGGMEMFGNALSSMATSQMQLDNQKEMAGVNDKYQAGQQYRSTVGTLAASGRLEQPGQVQTSPVMSVDAPGRTSQPNQPYNPMQPLPSNIASTPTPFSTHDIANAMGVQPQGTAMNVKGPEDKLAQRKAFFDYKMTRMGFGGSKDPLMAQAVSLVKALKPELVDADDAEITAAVNEVYRGLKATQGGKVINPPAKPVEEPKKSGGLWGKFFGSDKPSGKSAAPNITGPQKNLPGLD